MNNCVFCKMFENIEDKYLIIEPLNPVTPGHKLVIPRKHVEDFADDPVASSITMLFASTYAKEHGIEDANIITSKGKHATQTVFHLHLHIVPRREGDGLSLPWTGQHKGGGAK